MAVIAVRFCTDQATNTFGCDESKTRLIYQKPPPFSDKPESALCGRVKTGAAAGKTGLFAYEQHPPKPAIPIEPQRVSLEKGNSYGVCLGANRDSHRHMP